MGVLKLPVRYYRLDIVASYVLGHNTGGAKAAEDVVDGPRVC